MSRELCSFNTYLSGKLYCDYYDFGFYECREVPQCPGGLDEEESEEYFEEDFEDEE
jgi:hypothetical protein